MATADHSSYSSDLLDLPGTTCLTLILCFRLLLLDPLQISYRDINIWLKGPFDGQHTHKSQPCKASSILEVATLIPNWFVLNPELIEPFVSF